ALFMLKQIVFLLLFFVPILHAAEVDHLYQAEVSVADQGQKERNRAIAEGFRLMLVKVTGNRNIGQNQSLAETFRKASRFVQQYRYRVEVAESDTAVEQRYLRITFDKQAVDRTLRANGLPVWGKSRPQVIVWAGFDDGSRRKLLMPEFDQRMMTIFNRAADTRGIPLLFPVMDLQDQSAISASDLWGAFEQPVKNASQRYQADAILMVRIKSGSSGLLRSSWSFLDSNDTRQWEFRGKTRGQLIKQGMNTVSDHLASIYAPAAGADAQVVNMQVSGLDSFEDFLKVEFFLKGQETVQQYQLRQSQIDQVIFALSLRGGMQAFVQAVELSGLFAQSDVMFPVLSPEPAKEPEPLPVVNTPEQPMPENAAQAETGVDAMEQTAEMMVPEIAKDPLTDIHLFYRLR
ncbi:MAG: DUF2066 domain-containing protein, partial [Gammaproteobacteria bacterium]|nr:DUF2066 domain-containing protein [Gammaproteobacteria bacterium]